MVRGQLVGAGLCFHHENSGNSVLVVRLGGKHLYPPGCLTPQIAFFLHLTSHVLCEHFLVLLALMILKFSALPAHTSPEVKR